MAEEEIIHPLKGVNCRVKNFDVATAEEECGVFLIKIAGENCRRPKGTNGKITSCTCLSFLKEPDHEVELQGVAKYMVRFPRLRVET